MKESLIKSIKDYLVLRQIDLVEEGQELDHIKPIIEKEKKLIYQR